MESGSVYLHGSSEAEQGRLELMNEILNERSLAELGLRGGERVLELGAGTGIFAGALARAVGESGRVVAVERDERQLARARRAARDPAFPFDLRPGDATSPPLREEEWGSFDLTHARFLLEHLTEPQAAVEVMVRAVRPGGRIALVDDDHSLMRFWPDPEPAPGAPRAPWVPGGSGSPRRGAAALWADYAEEYRRIGCNPDVGRKLVALLVGAGARPVRTAMIHYGACAGEPGFSAVVENLAEVVGTARDAMLADSGWSAESFDAAIEGLRAWARREDAAIWYALPCAIGER